MGLFSARAFSNASLFHANQSTGLCACWSRYGDFSRARRLVCLSDIAKNLPHNLPCREQFCVAPAAPLRYAGVMLSKKPWQPELALLFCGAQLLCFSAGILAAALLHKAGLHGFMHDEDFGNILVATLSFQGATWGLIPV